LLITKSLSITGPGEAELTISGNHASRVFDLEQSGKNKSHQFIPQVSLSGMTISNGDVVGGPGGAILNNGSCTLTITNSILSSNSAGSGGAIYNVGTLTVNGCTLTDNSTSNLGSGGAIDNLGTLTVSPSSVNASLITNNSASEGGGIWNDGAATLTATILSGNSVNATGSAADGGGINNDLSGTLTLNGCTLYGNSAGSQGGGIFNGGSGAINLSGCTLADNSAGWGGGIFIRSGTATISGCMVGPAIVGGILLQGNSAQQGGGIYVESGTLTVTNSSYITGNSAPAGSGADVYNLGTLYWDGTGTFGKHDGNQPQPPP
jgi:predicted outer membrane repeat protein